MSSVLKAKHLFIKKAYHRKLTECNTKHKHGSLNVTYSYTTVQVHVQARFKRQCMYSSYMYGTFNYQKCFVTLR